MGSNSQGSIAGPSTDSSPSSADDPTSSLQQVSSGGGGGRRSASDSVPSANNTTAAGAPNSGRNSQRRRSTRHQNYLNRSQLHQAVDLPDGYGVHCLLVLFITLPLIRLLLTIMQSDAVGGWQEGQWWGAGVVVCLERGADLHMAQLMPLPLTVSCFSEVQFGFTFLAPAHPCSPGQRAVKHVCVCTFLVIYLLS